MPAGKPIQHRGLFLPGLRAPRSSPGILLRSCQATQYRAGGIKRFDGVKRHPFEILIRRQLGEKLVYIPPSEPGGKAELEESLGVGSEFFITSETDPPRPLIARILPDILSSAVAGNSSARACSSSF